MELKDYQKRALGVVDQYLRQLNDWRQKWTEWPEEARTAVHFPEQAWRRTLPNDREYNRKTTGIGDPLPHFCLKVPTGGGKTYLAVHAIDRVLTLYRGVHTGLVLWIVPTNQIYRQTLAALRDRQHPYRQVLDIATGGRVKVIEKLDRFTPQDVQTSLVILMLMLPSANRRDKETLKLFQDASYGLDAFFPAETDRAGHEDLLARIPNLDFFGSSGDWSGRLVKTSVGNALRILNPIVVLDEGQRAYSQGAQDTICGFNPSIIVELSATPPRGSNILVDIRGRELDQEEMIKLDIHVTNKASSNWKDTLADSVTMREALEEAAVAYESQAGTYIRPIGLIQVERTGSDQIDAGYIHAEHVKQALMELHGIPAEHIAIKSSDRDDIEGIDLLSRDCPVRYIITKQALQEGWDCPFAYVLTVLTAAASQMALTQLIGRILRQPYARKTGVPALDESYVFCFQRRAAELTASIKKGLESEGLGDLAHGVSVSDQSPGTRPPIRTVGIRDKFKRFEGKIYLPKFYVLDNDRDDELNYDMDLLSRVAWADIRLDRFTSLSLAQRETVEWEVAYGYAEEGEAVTAKEVGRFAAPTAINWTLLTRRLEALVPNPWVARDIVSRAINVLRDRYVDTDIAANQTLIAEELEKTVESERDRLCEATFRQLLEEGRLRLVLMTGKAYRVPSRIQIPHKTVPLTHHDGRFVQASLFDDPVPSEWFNDTLETPVALCLDSQEKLLFWYRNSVGGDYFSVQGWRKQRIWADFVATKKTQPDSPDYDTIYVLETKGDQLVGNADTTYKQSVFDVCNELGTKLTWSELGLEFPDRRVHFQVIEEREWERVVNELF